MMLCLRINGNMAYKLMDNVLAENYQNIMRFYFFKCVILTVIPKILIYKSYH